MELVFREVQRFNQWWVWLILTGVSLVVLASVVRQLLLGPLDGESPLPIALQLFFGLFALLLPWLFFWMRMETEIDTWSIRLRYVPFVSKTWKWEEVKSAEVINYGFVGGWGIRYWTRYGTVYNVKGRMGLAIQTKAGKQYVIGTQKPEALKQFLLENGLGGKPGTV